MPAVRLPRLAALLILSLCLLQLPAGASAPQSHPNHLIPFSSGTVDPVLDWEARDPADRDLVLVQWTEFGTAGVVDAIAGTGATLVQPLAPVSYIVQADAAQTAALRRIGGVRFAGVLPAAVRVAPSVDAETTLLRVTVVGSPAFLTDAATGLRDRPFTGIDGAVVEVPGNAVRAASLAALPQVYSVADAGSRPQLRDEKTVQAVAHGTSEPLTPGYDQFLDRVGADGSGVVFSEVDGGVDANHPELKHAIAGCFDYSAAPGPGLCAANNTDDAIGHGTHVLGHIVGTGSTGLGDSEGFAYGQGVAPGAKVIVQNAISLNALVPNPFANGYRPIYTEAYRAGAIFSQNSWGPAADPQGYDADTREFDTIVRDIDDDAAGHQEMGFVLSVMNGSGGESTQGAPDEAKNLIGVGGTGGRDSRTASGPTLDDLCTCTAHGPALDGRMLPTIVAPAQNVMSTRATQGTLCGNAAGGDDIPSPFHAPCTGTSFASPHVSGAYAVFVDWFRKHNDGETPSPALVKAALVNTADDLAGHKDADGNTMTAIPNNQQGWGRLNLGNVIDAWTAGAVFVDQSVVFDASAQSSSVTVEPIDPSEPMKATLTWTDAPGHGQGGELPAWVNDLDLTVSTPGGATYLGNVFADGMSELGGDADRMNNLENVYLATPESGTHTVSVTAANLIGDGLPQRDGVTDQDFALVITNARPVDSTDETDSTDDRPGRGGGHGYGLDKKPRR